MGTVTTGNNREHEISIETPLREYDIVDAWETPNPEAWRTEIGWPIFRSDGQT